MDKLVDDKMLGAQLGHDLLKPDRTARFKGRKDLLFLGVVMPTVFYIMWGIMEVATLPVAP